MLKKIAWIAPLAAVAFLFQTLVPFFATYQVPQHASAKEMASLFGDKVLLCTREGFRFVSWDDVINGQQPEPSAQYECALCYVAANGQVIEPSAAGIVVAASPAISKPLPPATDIFLAQSHWQEFLTRSPPLSFVA